MTRAGVPPEGRTDMDTKALIVLIDLQSSMVAM
jgi:hypothetical protein